MHYYALVDDDFPIERPLALLRRKEVSGPPEHYARDGHWWPDQRPELLSGEMFAELIELTADQAATLMPLWTAGPR